MSSSGTFAYQQLIKTGFPTHMNISDLYYRFEHIFYLFDCDCTDQKLFCNLLLRSSGLIRKDFKGNSKICFRIGKLELLNDKLSDDQWLIIDRFKKIGVLRSKWRTAIVATIKKLKMQTNSDIKNVYKNRDEKHELRDKLLDE